MFSMAMSSINVPFRGSQDLPISVHKIMLYIGFLSNRPVAPATMSTYISAIGYVHRIRGHYDPTSHPAVQKMLAATHKLNPRVDTRLPITIIILKRLVSALNDTVSNPYIRLLFHAMYIIAFFGLMRVGEITRAKNGVVALYLHQVQVMPEYIVLTISHFKHNLTCKPIELVLPAQADVDICPVRVMQRYLSVRGLHDGPLFCYVDNKPVSRDFFINGLKSALNFCGLDVSLYKSHSFRIGGASLYASLGLSDAQLRLIGRWNSDAFLRYIRCQRILLAVQKS